MILTKSNINPLPLLQSITEQIHRQRWGEKVVHYAPNDRLLPFVIFFETTVTSTLVIKLYDQYDNYVKTLDLTNSGASFLSNSNYKTLVYKGFDLTCGEFYEKLCYLKIEIGASQEVVYFSELFQPCTDSWLQDNCVSVEWWNKSNMPFGDYSIPAISNFRFQRYFLANINSVYEYQDILENRQKRVFAIQYISDIAYTFGAWITKHEMDAYRLSRIFDYIAINNRGMLYKPLSIDITTPEWDKKGAKGYIEHKFYTDAVTEKNAVATLTRGDFNDDYSDDFNNV